MSTSGVQWGVLTNCVVGGLSRITADGLSRLASKALQTSKNHEHVWIVNWLFLRKIVSKLGDQKRLVDSMVELNRVMSDGFWQLGSLCRYKNNGLSRLGRLLLYASKKMCELWICSYRERREICWNCCVIIISCSGDEMTNYVTCDVHFTIKLTQFTID